MALTITCSGCDADFSVKEELIGKTIRCKSCGESILVKAVKAKAAARVSRDEDEDEDDDDRPRNKVRPAAPARRRRDEDEEDDDRPAKKSNMPMIAFGIAALLIAGGVGAYFAMAGDKDKDGVAKVEPGAGRGVPRGSDAVAPGTDLPAKDETKKDEVKKDEAKKDETMKDETKKDEVKKDETKVAAETKPEDKKADEKKPEDKPKESSVVKTETPKDTKPTQGVAAVDKSDKISDRPITGVVSGQSGMPYAEYVSGIMPPVVLAKVKAASVYIYAEAGGGAGTGSGWFGIEEGIVFTNAHVLHMTAPNAPPPKKITFTLNAGQPNEREIPHSKIKILAVDREIDIAALQIINEPNLPPPLKVRPSLECMEGLRISTVGYPFGARVTGMAGASHKPEVSIRPTAITGFRRDDYGVIKRIQFEGAANPGNSGGPIVDAEGTVCTVVVAGFHGQPTAGAATGIALSFGVPTEYCFGLLAGRVYESKAEIAYKDGDKVRIPIKVKCLDPMKRLKTVGVAAWIGNPSKKFRRPGATKPDAEPGDRDYIETELKYDSATQMAVGEIVMPKKPDGTVYWLQPYYSNAIVTRYWQPGEMYKFSGDPADREEINLVFKPQAGRQRDVTMSTAALQPGDGEDAEGEGESNARRVLFRFGLNVNETAKAADPNDSVQAAKLVLAFKNLAEPKAVVNGGDEQLIPKSMYEQLNNEVKKCGALALVNKTGQVYKHTVTTVNVPNIAAKMYVDWFTESAVQSLKATSIELPNKMIKPDDTWTSTHQGEEVRQDSPPIDRRTGRPIAGAPIPPPRKYRFTENLTMKYVGSRVRDGRKEAMVTVDGKIVTASGSSHVATGGVRGYAFVEIDTGVVLQSHIDKEYEIDTSEKGVKKSVVGIFKFDVKRTSATN